MTLSIFGSSMKFYRWAGNRCNERCMSRSNVNVQACQGNFWPGCCWFQKEQACHRPEHRLVSKSLSCWLHLRCVNFDDKCSFKTVEWYKITEFVYIRFPEILASNSIA